MKTSHKNIRAFTLIELLIVIAIIAILTGIVVTSLAPAKGRARDAKRVSDLGNIQLAISLYFDRCKVYPSTIAGNLSNINNGLDGGTCTNNLGDFISVMPTDSASVPYVYNVNTNRSDYVLRATLENYSEILKDDLDVNPISGGASCTDTTSPYYYCLGSK